MAATFSIVTLSELNDYNSWSSEFFCGTNKKTREKYKDITEEEAKKQLEEIGLKGNRAVIHQQLNIKGHCNFNHKQLLVISKDKNIGNVFMKEMDLNLIDTELETMKYKIKGEFRKLFYGLDSYEEVINIGITSYGEYFIEYLDQVFILGEKEFSDNKDFNKDYKEVINFYNKYIYFLN